jgi:hypothetical protein
MARPTVAGQCSLASSISLAPSPSSTSSASRTHALCCVVLVACLAAATSALQEQQSTSQPPRHFIKVRNAASALFLATSAAATSDWRMPAWTSQITASRIEPAPPSSTTSNSTQTAVSGVTLSLRLRAFPSRGPTKLSPAARVVARYPTNFPVKRRKPSSNVTPRESTDTSICFGKDHYARARRRRAPFKG